MRIYIAGAHTDVGKTHFSALFCHTFNYDYFKLIQAGKPTDSEFVHQVSPKTTIHENGIFLKTPASPHIGKILENQSYNALDIKIPNVKNLIIELAGGILTPIDEKHTMLDYVCANRHALILVGKYYVGCINHILLSFEALEARGIDVLALVMMRYEKDSDTNLIDSFLTSKISAPLIQCRFYNKQNLESSSDNLRQSFAFLKDLKH